MTSETKKLEQIRQLLLISSNLEKLAEDLVADSDNETSVRLYGTLLDTAYSLRKSIKDLWKDSTEQ